jgi:heavy metal translocating P-type ATPase
MPRQISDSEATQIPRTAVCALCGLDVGRSKAQLVVNGEVHRFCCQGCRYVFEILFNTPEGPPTDFRNTELYRKCVASGLIARGDQETPVEPVANEPIAPGAVAHAAVEEGLSIELVLRVHGMWCSACSWLIEEVLRECKGVVGAEVHFLADTARIKYLPHLIHPHEMVARISSLGYGASLMSEPSEARKQQKDLLLRLGISAIFTANVMMISFAVYYGFFEDLRGTAIKYFAYPLAILSTPVIFYGGLPILRRAWAGISCGSASMEALIAVGALSSYCYSLFMTAAGDSLHLYFDTATMLVTLVLLGKYIEARARHSLSTGIDELVQLAGGKVRLLKEGRARWVSPEAVCPGDEFQVMTGERNSVDGIVISGRGVMDESAITGESRPVKKSVGEDVPGGSLLLEGELRLRASSLGSEGSLSQMISLMQEALFRKNRVEVMADRVTRRLVPAIISLAAATAVFLVLRGHSTGDALLRSISVLVITCPCALGIAAPLAKVASISVGRSHGILIRNHSALEKAKDADVWIMDKTGTVTEGNFSLRQIATTGIDGEEALRRVASVEAGSDHYLAREIRRSCNKAFETIFNGGEISGVQAERGMPATEGGIELSLRRWVRDREEQPSMSAHPNVEDSSGTAGTALPRASSFTAFDGLGVSGLVGGTIVIVGNRELMSSSGIQLPPALDLYGKSLESQGDTVVLFAWDGAARGLLSFGDVLRSGAKEMIRELRSGGSAVHLISGDSRQTTEAVGRELEIEDVRGNVLPPVKAELVKSLQEKGHVVAMVGDGINDAAALAQADIGFSFGARTSIVQKASDVTLLSNDPAAILAALRLSALATGVMRQNLTFAFLYNALGIPLAMFGLLNPLVAVMAMFGSSLTVVGNSLRITRTKLTAPQP